MSDSMQKWDTQYLGEIVEIMIGGTPSRANPRYWDSKKETKNIWVSIRDLNRSWITESTEYLSDEGVQNSNVKLIPKGTVLMSFKLTVGRVARAGRDLYTNEAIAAFEPKKNLSVVPEFLYYGLQEWDLLAEVDQAIKGATLNKEKLGRIACELPPLAEQKKIAEILSSVDEVIENTESEISKLEDLKKATLNELLTKGIGHTEFKDSEIGRIPKSWEFDLFGNHMAVRGGYAFRTADFVASRNEGLPLVRMSNLKAGICDLADAVYVAMSALKGRNQFELHEGDFIFGMSGSIGTHARIEKYNLPCYLNQRVGRLESKAKYSRFFEVVFLSQKFQAEMKALSAGGAQANISPSQIEDIGIAIPTPSEQEAIVRLDSAISKTIDGKSKFVEKIRILKTSLLQDLLTGKVRVKVN